MSAATRNSPTPEPRSATTGEPISTPSRRNRLGLWLCIVSDAAGTVALLVAYSYLWSLNVSDGWAPPGNAWASAGPFWLIVAAIVVAAIVMWWGVRGIEAGYSARLVTASAVASAIVLITFVGQIVQLATFPFGPSDGAYASATYWLALATAAHLFLLLFLVVAILNRTRRGLISVENPNHARLVAMWITWICIAAFLGALFATTMTASPNVNPPAFGTFQE